MYTSIFRLILKYFCTIKKEQFTRVYLESPTQINAKGLKITHQTTPNNINIKVVEYIIVYKKL